MIFTPEFRYEPNLFWELSPWEIRSKSTLKNPVYFFPKVPIKRKTSCKVRSIDDKIKSINLPLSLGISGDLSDPLGFFVYVPQVKVVNLGTGLLLTHTSWWKHSTNLTLEDGELKTVLRMEDFYIFHAENKVTILTSANLSERIDEHLTLI